MSAFHSASGIEEQESVQESHNEDNIGLVDEPANNQLQDTITAVESTLPQLPSLNFSKKEMCITGKSTITETNNINGDTYTKKSATHTRKSSAPPIPRKSSKRQSSLTKAARRRSPVKELHYRRFPKEPLARLSNGSNEQPTISQPVPSPSDPNAINASVAQTFKAMEELKPGSTNTLVVEKKRRLKAGAFLKVKNVLQGSFRRRKNDNSQEDSLDPLANSPQTQQHVSGRPDSLSDVDLRFNEGNTDPSFLSF